jgi:type IV pilus assembly protein PilC
MINLHIVQAMYLLLQSGQPLPDAVLAVSNITANKRIARDLQRLAAGLQEGEAFWRLLEAIPYIDPMVSSMARVGEETGNMPEVFEHAVDYSRHKVRQMSGRLNKLVEPAITLVLGLVLGLVMLSIILPAFAMTELVGY